MNVDVLPPVYYRISNDRRRMEVKNSVSQCAPLRTA
jgi:hypothetical protein